MIQLLICPVWEPEGRFRGYAGQQQNASQNGMSQEQVEQLERLAREAMEILEGSGSFRLRVLVDMLVGEIALERRRADLPPKLHLAQESEPPSSE